MDNIVIYFIFFYILLNIILIFMYYYRYYSSHTFVYIYQLLDIRIVHYDHAEIFQIRISVITRTSETTIHLSFINIP